MSSREGGDPWCHNSCRGAGPRLRGDAQGRVQPHTSSASSTIIRSFAHCSSSLKHVAFLGRGEAALRREAELVERDVFRRLVDAALELVLRFERAGLGW